MLTEVTDRARKLYEEALELPLTERAELAADLLASLDGEADQDLEAAWATEIERRVQAAIANPEDDVAWEDVRAEPHADPNR
jgi:putative addiction module component (TIGR02574 family)